MTILAIAAVAATTGTLSALFGSALIPGANRTDPSVESELHFYAVWWLGAGLFLASLAPTIERRATQLRVFCALLFLTGVARLVAAAQRGWPHPIYLALMGLELLLPPVLVLWQARVGRTPVPASDG